MKRAFLYSIVSLVLITILLFRLGFFYVNISPHNSYRLNETEKTLIDNATSQLKERIENGKFDEIQNEFIYDEQDIFRQNYIINDFKKDRAEFGKSLSWEFFDATLPQPDNELNGKRYNVEYITKTEKGEVWEHFIWLIKADNEIKLIFGGDMDTTRALQVRLEERDRQKSIVEKYPNEIIIPYADRFIEFRY
jgi:hypothetical protein